PPRTAGGRRRPGAAATPRGTSPGVDRRVPVAVRPGEREGGGRAGPRPGGRAPGRGRVGLRPRPGRVREASERVGVAGGRDPEGPPPPVRHDAQQRRGAGGVRPLPDGPRAREGGGRRLHPPRPTPPPLL